MQEGGTRDFSCVCGTKFRNEEDPNFWLNISSAKHCWRKKIDCEKHPQRNTLLDAIFPISSGISKSLLTGKKKRPYREVSRAGSIPIGKCLTEKYPTWKCPRRGSVPIGKCPAGMCMWDVEASRLEGAGHDKPEGVQHPKIEMFKFQAFYQATLTYEYNACSSLSWPQRSSLESTNDRIQPSKIHNQILWNFS